MCKWAHGQFIVRFVDFGNVFSNVQLVMVFAGSVNCGKGLRCAYGLMGSLSGFVEVWNMCLMCNGPMVSFCWICGIRQMGLRCVYRLAVGFHRRFGIPEFV